jgi:hypothetical protein
MIGAMSTRAAVDRGSTYGWLRGVFEPYVSSFDVVTDTPKAFYLASKTAKTRSGAAVWFGGAQIMKNYVSFHLIPVYADPALLKQISPALRKRLHGRACFNFTTVDAAQLAELTTLTRKGYESFTRQFA